MNKTLTMTVSATEPISGTFPITLEGPGLYLLDGPPEAGKSNILDSLLFAYLKANGGDPKRDRFRVAISYQAAEKASQSGAEAVGQVTLPGINGTQAGVKIYASTIRRLPAPPAVQILDGTPFVQLTRNGLTDPKTRQPAELKAFASITQVRCTTADLVIEDMRGDVADLDVPAGEPLDLLPDVGEKVRKRFHALNGRFEDDAAATDRKLTVCRAQADKEAAEANVWTVAKEQERLMEAEQAAVEVRMARHGRAKEDAQRRDFAAIQPATRPDVTPVLQRLEEARAESAQRIEEARTLLAAELDHAAEGTGEEPPINDAEMAYIRATRVVNGTREVIAQMDKELSELEEIIAKKRADKQAAEARLE